MKSTFRYRIWDKKYCGFQKTVYYNYNDCYLFLDHFACVSAVDKYGDEIELSQDDYIIQFSTGLFDKDSTEIYEGDIVSWENRFDEDSRGAVTYVAPSWVAIDHRGEKIPLDARCKVKGHINSNFNK